jgi:diketogulonate reductase-like aldo/keto reductase
MSSEDIKTLLTSFPNDRIDTAVLYKTQAVVGKNKNATQKITTKSRISELDVDKTLAELLCSDSSVYEFLLHTPKCKTSHDRECAWRTLTNDKRIERCGVSNFSTEHIRKLLEAGLPKPKVNQIEMHVGCLQREIIDYCQHEKIEIQSYSTMGSGVLIQNHLVRDVASKCGCTEAQLLVGWAHIYGANECVVRTSNLLHYEELCSFHWDMLSDCCHLETLSSVDDFRVCPDYTHCE